MSSITEQTYKIKRQECNLSPVLNKSTIYKPNKMNLSDLGRGRQVALSNFAEKQDLILGQFLTAPTS